MPPKPEPTTYVCPLCERVIEPGERFMQEESGWVKPRTQGGTNALILRHLTGRFAHYSCVEVKNLGVDPNQLRFLDG